MNLKSAAHRLGVHYQTAYRWVRTGELVAIRSGTGYEVSDAAVELMVERLATRDRMTKYIVPPSEPGKLSFRDEVELLLAECTLSAQPVFDVLVRKLAATVGDTAVLYLADSSDGHLRPMAAFDADPARRALVDAVHASGEMNLAGQPGVAALLRGHALSVHHLKVEHALALVPARFREHAQRVLVQSIVAAPVVMADGRSRGLIALVRYSGAPAFPPDATSWVSAAATYTARAIEQVSRFSAAWAARETLFKRLEHVVFENPLLDLRVDIDAINEVIDPAMPEAVFDPSGNLVAASEAFLERVAPEAVTLADASAVVAGAFAKAHHAQWQRVLSGGTDFVSTSQHIEAMHPDDHVQWAVVRRRDLTPVAVVAVCELLTRSF